MSDITVINSYNIQISDDVIRVSAVAPVSVVLPSIGSVAENKEFTVIDISGQAATNNITVGSSDGTLINGTTTYSTINVNGGSLKVTKLGGVWSIANNVNAMQGPASSTDNVLVRFDGTSGKVVQSSTVVLSDVDALSGQKMARSSNTNVTTGYTLVESDCAKMIHMTLSVSRALTLPNSFIAGWNCDTLQLGAGQIVYTAASGSTLTSNAGITTSKSIWARGQLYVSSNASGTSAVWVLNGDTGV